MIFVLLSRSSGNLYTIRRLKAVAADCGHDLLVINPQECYMTVGDRGTSLFMPDYEIDFSNISAVLPRLGAAITEYGIAVVNQFELLGVPVINSSQALARSRDKLKTLQILAKHRIPIPRTVMARRPDQIKAALSYVGGPPVILKLMQGTQGVGVLLADSESTIESTLDAFWSLGQDIQIQEFISESRGVDIRALVIGGNVAVAMRRKARIGEFRSNIHRGGAGEIVNLDKEYIDVALKAANVIGLEIAGVDILESSDGPKVLEVNASPGFEGLEEATDLDIAKLIMDYAVKAAKRLRRADDKSA